MKSKYKLAMLFSHPIHYLLGVVCELEKHPDVEVMTYFCSDFGIRRALDTTFGKVVKWYDKDILEGISHKFIRNYSPASSLSNFFSVINPEIISELKKNDYDAIIIHGWHFFSYWLSFFGALLTKTPILLYGENPLNQELKKPKWKIFVKKILFGKILFPRISAFLYIGKENRKFYKYYGVSDEKLFFVPYSIDNDKFMREHKNLKSKRVAFKKEIGINLSTPTILFLGKLIEKKRPMDLLRAYEKVEVDNKALVFVADGPLRRSLEDYAKSKDLQGVYFVGFKHQEEVPKYYTLADIFVLPSGMGETWGLVTNEAMCFSLPVIVSNMVGCGSDLVKHGENGFIFPLGDIKKLAEHLEDLIMDNRKREKLGQKSLEIIQGYSYRQDFEGILSALTS